MLLAISAVQNSSLLNQECKLPNDLRPPRKKPPFDAEGSIAILSLPIEEDYSGFLTAFPTHFVFPINLPP
jgi:hypothetical protein